MSPANPAKVRFWGVRGSIASPGPETQRYGGNTSCVELRMGGRLIILDAGTGLRPLGNALMSNGGGPVEADIFISHTHWDHIQGFPFFIPAYVKGNKIRVRSAHGAGKSFEQALRGQMDPTYFPVQLGDMSAELEIVEVREGLKLGPVEVRSTFTNHPGVDLAYRFDHGGKSVVYLTDHETYQTMNPTSDFARKQDDIVRDFCRDADLLIGDAQYTEEDYETKRGWGHSIFKETLRLSLEAGVKKLALFHHDPARSDDEVDKMVEDCVAAARRQGSPLEVLGAQEGLELVL